MKSRSVVAYYSWSGKTKAMAEAIGRQTGARVVEIAPETPYPKDYDACVAKAKEDINAGFLPPIKETGIDPGQVDVLYVGSPIWWGTLACPVATFLGSRKWEGTVVKPFTTHGGGGKGRSDVDLAKLVPGARVKEMFTTYEGSIDEKFAAWVLDTK